MPDDTDFERRLAQRLQAYESRIPDAEPPDPQARRSGSRRRMSVIGASFGLVAAVALAAVMLSRFDDETGESPVPSPSTQSSETPTPETPEPTAASPTALPVGSERPAALADGTQLRVQVDGLRLRDEPSTSGSTTTTLSAGAVVTFLGGNVASDGQDWYEVRHGESRGWVAAGPDRDWLAVIGNGRIGFWCLGCEDDRSGAFMTVEPDGTDPRIENDAMAVAGWSPDGSQVVLVVRESSQEPGRMELYAPDGTLLRDLGPGNGVAWSPDGSRFAFADPSARTIVLVEGDSQVGQPVPDGGLAIGIRWSPDGQRIAFTATCSSCEAGGPAVEGDPMALYVLDTRDGAIVKLTERVAFGILTWSPDGSEIIVSEVEPTSPTRSALHRIDVATGADRELGLAEAGGSGLEYSPDGSRVAFGTRDGIVVANADGTDRTIVVPPEPGLGPSNPRWSPDGQWLLYDLLAIQGDAIFPAVARSDGTDRHTLVEHDGYDASWQPVLTPLPGG